MADPKELIPIIKKWEGGFADHPLDKGGPTMRGITLKTFRKFYGKDKSVEDLKKLTEEQWYHIFRSGYWDPFQADYIHNQAIANILVDWAWGSGSITAIKQVQKYLGVKVDGIVGPETLGELNKRDSEKVFTDIWNLRKQFFLGIVERNPSQKIFLKGWLNRLSSFTYKNK